MDSLFEILIPILFAVVYLIGGALKGKGNEADGDSEASSQEAEGTSLSDRERKIQEEIRRKIRERQQGGGSSSTGGAETATPPAYDPTRPEWAQRGDRRAGSQPEEEPERSYRYEREPEPEREPAWESSGGGAFMETMEQRRREIAETQRKAQEMKDLAARDMRKAKKDQRRERMKHSPYGLPGQRRRLTRSGSFRDEVIAGLYDPGEFRRSIITYEILGTPVGERRQGKIGPFWEQ